MTSPSSDMGGAEKTFWFLSSQVKEDKKYEIYGAFPRGNLYPKLRANFKQVQALFFIEFIPRGLSPFSILRWPLYVLTLIINFLLCLKMIWLEQIDMVYVNSSIQFSAVLAARLTNRKLIVFVLEDYYYSNPGIRDRLFAVLSKNSEILLCQNKKLEKDLRSYGGKVEMIYASAYEIESQPGHPKKTDPRFFNIGLVGKIYPLKGQAIMIAALGLLVKEGMPIKAHILGGYRMFSKNYFYYKELKRTIHDKCLMDNVVFDEPASLSQIYQGLDAVVIASNSEGFSLVYPEALKFGKPVISTRTGVMVDVGRDGENLIFFKHGNVLQLAEKIKLLYSNKGLYDRLVKNGKETYEIHFDKEKISRQFLHILDEVANARRD